jgi:hypothetical protein
MNKWFNANLLSLNFDKTYFMKFQTKNNFLNEINITNNKIISNTSNLKFLGIIIDNTLSWKSHIDMIVPKLSQACFIATVIKPFLSWDTLKMIYYEYFHAIITYGLIFWANSSHSGNIFKLQKKIIRIIMRARPKDSWTELFKVLKILPLTSQYIFSLTLFVANNKSLFKENSKVHNIKTRNSSNLFQPSSHLMIYQKDLAILASGCITTIFPPK